MPPLANRVKLPNWEVLGSGEAIVPNGTSVDANVPDTNEIVEIISEGGVAYYQYGGIASPTSGGFLPENGRNIIGPLRDFTELAVFAAAGVTVHILYYRENWGR